MNLFGFAKQEAGVSLGLDKLGLDKVRPNPHRGRHVLNRLASIGFSRAEHDPINKQYLGGLIITIIGGFGAVC